MTTGFAAVFGLHTEALVTAAAAAADWVELEEPSVGSSALGALDSVGWKAIERSLTVMAVDSEQRLAVRLVSDKSLDSVDELAHILRLKMQKQNIQ